MKSPSTWTQPPIEQWTQGGPAARVQTVTLTVTSYWLHRSSRSMQLPRTLSTRRGDAKSCHCFHFIRSERGEKIAIQEANVTVHSLQRSRRFE